MTVHFDRRSVGAIVLDIEGTTTPIAFVYDRLFRFVRSHLREHLHEHRDSDELRAVVLRLRQEWAEDVARGEAPPAWTEGADNGPSSIAAYVEWLMDRDRKSSALKSLQGLILEHGYLSGTLMSDIFPDVKTSIQRWRASGVDVAIYSSGSVLAQRLLFAHTPEGDLTPYLSGFFDTAVGAKTSSDSYRQIATALQYATNRLLFVSDAPEELEAAREAGCVVLLCARPGHPDRPAAGVDTIHSLEEIVVS